MKEGGGEMEEEMEEDTHLKGVKFRGELRGNFEAL